MTKLETTLAEERERLEALVWAALEWRGPREPIDRIMIAVDRYATAKAEYLRLLNPPMGPGRRSSVEVEKAIAALERHQEQGGMVPDTEPSVGATKTCKACGEDKSPLDFNRDKQRKDGLSSRCKRCVKEGKLIPRA